jgi:hypothetical protein
MHKAQDYIDTIWAIADYWGYDFEYTEELVMSGKIPFERPIVDLFTPEDEALMFTWDEDEEE